MTRTQRVVVLGGGIVGLACADALVSAGHDVTVLDPAPGRGASYAAAGMLAPGGEAWFGEEALLRLGIAGARLWPDYAADLERRSGHDVDRRTTGTLLVGVDRDDVAEVRRNAGLLAAEGVEVHDLTGREARREEPRLAHVAGGALLPHDHQVNPRRVVAALLHLLGDRVQPQHGTPTPQGVLREDGTRLDADVVVLARGAAAARDVRPVRGEVVRARTPDPPVRVLRARVHGEQVYVVPRAGGEVVVGATEEEHPADREPLPRLGGVARLLEAARTVLPGLDTAELLEVVARDRPGSRDNGPVLGPVASGGPARHLRAEGHYRSGVLLAPVTAAAVRAHVDGTTPPPEAEPFAASRLDKETL